MRPSLIPAEILGRQFQLGGDIILSVEGILVSHPKFNDRIAARLAAMRVGERLTIEVLRSGHRLELLYYRLR